jgi:hypothetical protein
MKEEEVKDATTEKYCEAAFHSAVHTFCVFALELLIIIRIIIMNTRDTSNNRVTVAIAE